MNSIAAYILDKSSVGWIILILLILITAPGISLLRIDSSLENWFLEDDPALLAYNQFKSEFGNDETILLMIKSDKPVDSDENIEVLKDLSLRLDNLPYVRSIVSRFSFPSDDILEIEAVKRLIETRNPNAAVFWLLLESMDDPDPQRAELLDNLQEVEGDYPAYRFYKAGYGVLYHEINRISVEDSAKFIGGSYVTIIAVLIIALRRFKVVLSALLGLSSSFIIAFGIMGYAGWSINMVSMVLPSLLFAIVVADIMHVIKVNMGIRSQQPDLDSREAAIETLNRTIKPCFYTTVTTFFGFLSLTVARINVIREFGMIASLSVTIAFIVILLITMPLTLRWISGNYPIRKIQKSLTWASWVNGIARRKILIIVSISLMMTLLTGGIFKIITDTYSIRYLLPDNSIRISSDNIEMDFGNYLPLDILINTTFDQTSDSLWIQKITRFIDRVDRETALQKGVSPFDEVPPNLLPFPLVRDNGRLTRIIFRSPMESARKLKMFEDEALEIASQELGENINIAFAGYMPLYTRMMKYITEGQLNSFGLAFIVITLLMKITLKKWRRVLLSIIPNLLPVLGTLGLMGWLNIRLDIATVTIAAVAIGIVVDDTIHILHHYYSNIDNGKNVLPSLISTFEITGSAVISTSLTLIAGMVVLLFAQIFSIIYFAFLLSMCILLALLCDLVFLPALLLTRD